MKLEPVFLPSAIKKAEKGKRAASLVTFPSCKSQPASLHTQASGANSRAGTWQTSSGTELPKEVGRACNCVHTRVLAFLPPAGCFGEGERAGLARQLLPRSTERCLQGSSRRMSECMCSARRPFRRHQSCCHAVDHKSGVTAVSVCTIHLWQMCQLAEHS